MEKIIEAAEEKVELIALGETLIPRYPQWVSPSSGAKFNDSNQKKAYAKYWQESLELDESKIITEMRKVANKHSIMLMGGLREV